MLSLPDVKIFFYTLSEFTEICHCFLLLMCLKVRDFKLAYSF